MKHWNETWGPLATLLATAVLIVVTGWYACLTRSLTKSSERAAKSAEATAKSAAQSTAAAVAGVDVDFGVRPVYGFVSKQGAQNGEERSYDVEITCKGAAVFVHGCRLNYLGMRDDNTGTVALGEGPRNLQLIPLGGATPVKRHRSEGLTFILPPESQDMAHVVYLNVSVFYSLDGVGPVSERLVQHWESQR